MTLHFLTLETLSPYPKFINLAKKDVRAISKFNVHQTEPKEFIYLMVFSLFWHNFRILYSIALNFENHFSKFHAGMIL